MKIAILVIVGAAIAIAGCRPAGRRNASAPAGPSPDAMTGADKNVSDEVARHAARNRELVRRIRQKGGDLGALRTIDLHFWAPDEAAAGRLSEALREFGTRKVASNPGNDGTLPVWSVDVEARASVDQVVATAFVERLVALAIAHGADFDGWGTHL